MPTTYRGGCACGAIRYEIAAEPLFGGQCQCHDCQHETGSGHSSFLAFPADAVKLTGEPRYYEATADSGNLVGRGGFCGACGSSVISAHERHAARDAHDPGRQPRRSLRLQAGLRGLHRAAATPGTASTRRWAELPADAADAGARACGGVSMAITTQKITPCLWFDGEAEQAAETYVAIFENSRVLRLSRYVKEGHEIHGRAAGSVMTVEFELEGQKFVALNGGPQFKFNEAISFQVHCETQDEIDHFWSRLSEQGEEGPCGWLKDRFRRLVAGRAGGAVEDADGPQMWRRSQRVTKAFHADEEARHRGARAGVRGEDPGMTIEVIWGSGSPYAWRVLLTLEVKGLTYKIAGDPVLEGRAARARASGAQSARQGAGAARGRLRAVEVARDDGLSRPAAARSAAVRQLGRGDRADLEGDRRLGNSSVAPVLRRIVVPVFLGQPLDAADLQAAAGELDGEFRRMAEAAARQGWLAGARLSAADLAVLAVRRGAAARRRQSEALRDLGLGILPFAERYPALEDWRLRVAALPGYARTYPPHWREVA